MIPLIVYVNHSPEMLAHFGMIPRKNKPWFQGSGEQWGRDEIYPEIMSFW